jgi:predicted RecA/RadA family phage recombinase
MAANFIEEGCVLHWVNGTGVAVASGQAVPFGMFGMAVALVAIAIGASGSVQTEGVFELDKAAGVITQGQKLWWDNTALECLNAPALGSYFIGYASEAALTGDATCFVSLEEFSNEGSRTLTLAATGNQTIGVGDLLGGQLNLFVPNTGAKTLALPSVADIPQAELFIRKTDATAQAVTLDPAGSELIAGGATFATIDANNDLATFVSNGTAWLLKSSVIA